MARQGAISVEELIRKKVATMRRWKKTKLLKRQSKWDFQFTLMTYNILSQTAVENHKYLYKNCSPAFLQEDYRISKILPEILQSKSDIICLQEVEQNLFDNRIRKFFDSNGFASVFKRRTGCRTDGCAILWKKRKFDLVNHSAIEFRSKDCPLLNRDNIGLIAVLKPNHPKSDNILLHIATTHLLFNPKRGDIKLCQIRWLIAELERMSLKKVCEKTRHYHPVILCGDFNFEPFSPLYQFVENGLLNVANIQSGNFSGQAIGKDKGGIVNFSALLLHKMGISQATRFEDVLPNDVMVKKKCATTNASGPVAGSSSSFLSKKNQAGCESFDSNFASGSNKSFDQVLQSALGNSTDRRWMQTLLALSNKRLAADLAARMQSEPDVKTVATSDETTEKYHLSQSIDESSDSEMEEEQLSLYHDFKFVPAYRYHYINPKDLPITSVTAKDHSNVDHIFYNVKKKNSTTSYSEGKLRLLAVYSLLYPQDVEELGGMPNAYLGSDHISLMAKFALSFNR